MAGSQLWSWTGGGVRGERNGAGYGEGAEADLPLASDRTGEMEMPVTAQKGCDLRYSGFFASLPTADWFVE